MIVTTKENKTFKVPNNSSILSAALNAGLVFEYSCKNGQCGICKTTLIKGEVKELQPQLGLTASDLNTKKILTCCCTPKTNLLINATGL